MSHPGNFFVLSPAHSGGKRARQLTDRAGTFDLSVRLRTSGIPLGDAYTFMSSLYFRGKLTYATTFARVTPRTLGKGIGIITPGRGLLPPDHVVTDRDLAAFAEVPIEPGDPRYREPLMRDLRTLAETLDGARRIVLLGSIATGKYVDPLTEVFGSRVWFPREFVGRGDMSRGGLLLRSAASGRELKYTPVMGAQRTGRRPLRLDALLTDAQEPVPPTESS